MCININNHNMNDLDEMFERIREHNSKTEAKQTPSSRRYGNKFP